MHLIKPRPPTDSHLDSLKSKEKHSLIPRPGTNPGSYAPQSHWFHSNRHIIMGLAKALFRPGRSKYAAFKEKKRNNTVLALFFITDCSVFREQGRLTTNKASTWYADRCQLRRVPCAKTPTAKAFKARPVCVQSSPYPQGHAQSTGVCTHTHSG